MAVNKINLMAIICMFKIVFLSTVSANDVSPALQCFITMQSYCHTDDPTALDCARAAIVSWKTELPIDYMQEYYEALYDNLVIEKVETPNEFCRKKGYYRRKACTDELKNFHLEGPGCKREQLNTAVRYAFFEAVLSNEDKISNTPKTKKRKKAEYSDKYNYLTSIQQNINVEWTMDSAEEFCRTKFEPGYKRPALRQCLLSMENYCRVRDPTAMECARAALKYWDTKFPEEDMQEYYETLYRKLNMNAVLTPKEFCQAKRLDYRRRCKEDLKNYYLSYSCCRKEEVVHAVTRAFFEAALSNDSGTQLTRTYEEKYIISINEDITLKDGMDSPEIFCRAKHEPGYTKPV